MPYIMTFIATIASVLLVKYFIKPKLDVSYSYCISQVDYVDPSLFYDNDKTINDYDYVTYTIDYSDMSLIEPVLLFRVSPDSLARVRLNDRYFYYKFILHNKGYVEVNDIIIDIVFPDSIEQISCYFSNNIEGVINGDDIKESISVFRSYKTEYIIEVTKLLPKQYASVTIMYTQCDYKKVDNNYMDSRSNARMMVFSDSGNDDMRGIINYGEAIDREIRYIGEKHEVGWMPVFIDSGAVMTVEEKMTVPVDVKLEKIRGGR